MSSSTIRRLRNGSTSCILQQHFVNWHASREGEDVHRKSIWRKSHMYLGEQAAKAGLHTWICLAKAASFLVGRTGERGVKSGLRRWIKVGDQLDQQKCHEQPDKNMQMRPFNGIIEKDFIKEQEDKP
jgi:hypothetical protein